MAALSEKEKKPLKELVIPTSYNLFDLSEKSIEVAIAYEGEVPVGLIAAYLYPSLSRGMVVSCFVKQGFRGQGIGLKLMQKLVDKLQEEKIRLCLISYNDWEESAHVFAKILQKTGWHEPKTAILHFYFDPKTFHPDWFESDTLWLPKDVTLFPWKEITKDEEETIKRWLKQNPQLNMFTPFGHKEPVDLVTSLGLRKNGEIMGWLVNHYKEPNIHRYTSLFVHPEIRGLGPGASLLKASIKQHVTKEPHLEGMGLLSEQQAPLYWKKFIDKRLMPFSTRQERVMSSWWGF